MIRWTADHALLLLLTAGTVFTFLWLCRLRDRLRIKWYAALPVAVLHTLYGVLTVTVFAFLETGFDTDSLGNMSLFGGVFFMPLAYWLGAKLSKRKMADVFDIFTICMIFTLMCARINCIIAGCCVGLPIPGLTGVRTGDPVLLGPAIPAWPDGACAEDQRDRLSNLHGGLWRIPVCC